MTQPVRISLVPLPPGSNFARLLKALPHGPEYAAAQFADTPIVAHALNARITRTNKAAVAGMTTTNQSDLADLGIIDSSLSLMLGGESAPQACFSRMQERPFAIQIPRQTDAGVGGGRLDEGAPVPVVKGGLFDTMEIPQSRVGSIFCVTQDVLRRKGNEAVLRNAALAAQGRVETRLFLDPSVAAAGLGAASITHGQTEIPWDGDAAHTLGLMLSSIQTQGTRLVWIGRPIDFAILAARLGGAASLPATMLGLPAIAAPNAPAGLIVLADLGEIAFAASTLEVDISEQASIQMTDTPTNSPAAGSPEAPVATTLVSLFQTNSVGYLIWRFLNWEVIRSGAVAYSIISGSPA